jgi:hypothetical protein
VLPERGSAMAALTASTKDAEQHETDTEHLSNALHRLSLPMQRASIPVVDRCRREARNVLVIRTLDGCTLFLRRQAAGQATALTAKGW